MFSDKILLITGGTGSFGNAVLRRFLENPGESTAGGGAAASAGADYSMPNVSEKVVRIIVSYTDYVKRSVWKEY